MTLITSFEPFGGQDRNYSMMALDLIPSSLGVDRLILPVCYKECYRVLGEQLERRGYDNIILLGQASGRRKVTLEKIAINWASATIRDNDGYLAHGEKLVEGGPDGIFSTVDVTGIVEDLRIKGFDADVSFSAGTYVCNALYYQTLLENQDKKVVFIHVPAMDAENSAHIIESVIDQMR